MRCPVKHAKSDQLSLHTDPMDQLCTCFRTLLAMNVRAGPLVNIFLHTGPDEFRCGADTRVRTPKITQHHDKGMIRHSMAVSYIGPEDLAKENSRRMSDILMNTPHI